MNILEYIILFAGLAYLIYEMRFKDAYKASLQEIWTTPAELNSLFKGKDGYYSETKGWIIDGIVVAIFLLTAFLMVYPYGKLVVGLIFAGIAGGLHLSQKKDWERFKRIIAAQKAVLTNLKREPSRVHIPNPRIRGFGKKTAWVVSTFYDFHEDILIEDVNDPVQYAQDQERAANVILSRLVALANKDESEWFKEKRSK